MCGIIGYINKDKPANDEVLTQFQRQLSRGKEGFGLISIELDGTYKVERSVEQIKATVDMKLSQSPIMLFHHRMPTSTPNEIEQTHPIFVSHDELTYDWYIVHNGVISNSDDTREMHENDLGYVYTTKKEEKYRIGFRGTSYRSYSARHNDSEPLAIETARYLEGLSEEISTEGRAAFGAAKIDKKTNKVISVLFGRIDGSPMLVASQKDGVLFASEAHDGEQMEELLAIEIPLTDIKKTKDFTQYIEDTEYIALKVHTEPVVQGVPSRTSALPAGTATSDPKTPEQSNYACAHTAKTTEGDLEKLYNNGERDTKGKYAQCASFIGEREEAFYKMSQRSGKTIQEFMDTFFMQLAYNDLGSMEINALIDEFENIIDVAVMNATKVRHLIDIQEKRGELENEAAYIEDTETAGFPSNESVETHVKEVKLFSK